jgi:hypothetical protein
VVDDGWVGFVPEPRSVRGGSFGPLFLFDPLWFPRSMFITFTTYFLEAKFNL